ncbi:MAG: hypothetical protein ACXWX2_05080 [Actinomycetota bacterium]
MRTCPSCAAENPDEATTCGSCGGALLPNAPPEPGLERDERPLQYTHSGARYLLGYGGDFFGIWDRQRPGGPVSRFPRTDAGWRAAWLAFTADEPYSSEVGIGSRTGSASPGAATPVARRQVNPAWWLLPIFMGWLGGLIAWLVNKDVDPQRARSMLVTGIVVSVVLLALVVMTSPTPGS